MRSQNDAGVSPRSYRGRKKADGSGRTGRTGEAGEVGFYMLRERVGARGMEGGQARGVSAEILRLFLASSWVQPPGSIFHP